MGTLWEKTGCKSVANLWDKTGFGNRDTDVQDRVMMRMVLDLFIYFRKHFKVENTLKYVVSGL